MGRARLLVASVSALLLIAGLTACTTYRNSPSDGGRTSDEVAAALEAVPGIDNANAYTKPWYSPGEGGLFSSTGIDLVLWVTIDAEMHIADGEQFLREVGRAAWSINDGRSPQGNVTLVVTRGVDSGYDWVPDAVAVFGEGARVTTQASTAFMSYDDEPELGLEETVVSLPHTAYEAAFGAWPAEPGEVASGIFAAGAPAFIEPEAVQRFQPRPSYGEHPCVYVSFTRNLDRDGRPYAGPVTVTLLIDGREFGTEVAAGVPGDDEGGVTYVKFCDDRLITPEAEFTVNVSAPESPGFQGVEREGVEYEW